VKAPVSKGVLVIAALTTLTASAYKAASRLGLTLDLLVGRREIWRVFTYQLAFSTAGELVLGLVLLYTFRQFERQWGSRRFGCFVVLSSALASLFGIGALVLARPSLLATFRIAPALAGGPYGLIFASLVQYYFDVPPVNTVKVFGMTASPKTVTYLMSLQLAVASPGSTLAALSGILAGLLYRSPTLNLRSVSLPSSLVSLISSIFLPLLESEPNPRHRHQHGFHPHADRQQQQQQHMAHEAPIPPWAMQQLHHRQPPAPQQAAGQPRNDEEAMATLAGMGFVDRARNQRLLDMYNGHVHRVIDELCRE